MRLKSKQIGLAGLFASSLFLIGCIGGTHIGDKYQNGGEEISQAKKKNNKKIAAESFLFDVKYFNKGKKNSFRLEVYYTDSLAGLAGRGYLGKGALKGWLSHDSLAVYFPTVKEHLYESVFALLSQYECSEMNRAVDLLSIFTTIPQKEKLPESILLEVDNSKPKRPVFYLSDKACPWSLSLTYDQQSSGWRLRKFDFDDGRETRLKGNRRKLKENSKVPESRFRLDIPATSVGIKL